MRFLMNLHHDESGQDLVEYALVLAAIVAAVIAGSTPLTKAIGDAITALSTKIQSAIGSIGT